MNCGIPAVTLSLLQKLWHGHNHCLSLDFHELWHSGNDSLSSTEVVALPQSLSFTEVAMGCISTGMGDRFSALLVFPMALHSH